MSTPSLTSMTIEVSNLCNYRCQMCVSHGGELVKGQSSFAKGMPRFIDRSFFYDVADQYKALSQDGSKFLMPQYRGECFLHPGFIEICEHLERIDMPFGFTTNAALLTQEKTEALLAMSKFTAIVFSIDGATKETFEKIRLRGNYDQVMENVQRFLELARPRIQAGSLMASVNFTLQPDNAHEKEQMIEQWADRSFQVTFSNLAVNGRPTKLPRTTAGVVQSRPRSLTVTSRSGPFACMASTRMRVARENSVVPPNMAAALTNLGNLVYRHTAMNFNPMMATAGKKCVAEVEILVETGELDPDAIHTPGIYVDRIVKGAFEKRIEQRTITKRENA